MNQRFNLKQKNITHLKKNNKNIYFVIIKIF